MPEAISSDVQNTFKRKVGPIPVWGWSIVFVGSLGAFLYVRQRRANGSQGASGGSAVPLSPTDTIGPYTNSGGGGGSGDTQIGGTGANTNPGFDASAWELWLRPLLTALVANTQPRTTPVTTPPPAPTPPPSSGTPTGTVQRPPGMLSGGPTTPPSNVPTTQVPAGNHVINVAGGAIGIPQSALTGTFNIVHLGEGIHVNDLEGWTAWAPPSNISAFAGAPSGSYSSNPNNAWQQWGSGEYIPGGSYVALMKTGTAQPGFQPRAA